MKEEFCSNEIRNMFSAMESVDSNVLSSVEEKVNRIIENHFNDPAVSSPIDLADLAGLFTSFKIPELPQAPDEFLTRLEGTVMKHAVHTFSPRYIGHMTAALPGFIQPLARLMVAFNQNSVKMETSRSLSPFEREALAMMHRLLFGQPDSFYEKHIQHPDSTLGIMTSGGTVANITALWAARNRLFGPTDGFAGIESRGLVAALRHYDCEAAVVVGSELLHYSFNKAVDLMGIGLENLVKVPVDENFSMRIDLLEETLDRLDAEKKKVIAVVGVAGSTDMGAVDNLAGIGEVARKRNLHFHVDGAWGGPTVFSRQHRPMLAGIEEADSITIDGHKQLFLPMGNGMVLFRDPLLAKGIEKNAPYIIRSGSTDLGKRALEGSRPAMALLLQATLNLIGMAGFEYMINEGIRKTRQMAGLVSALNEYELLFEPRLNILLYRYLPIKYRARVREGRLTQEENGAINLFNENLQKRQRREGRTFISRTTINRHYRGERYPTVALRAVISNPLTEEADLQAVIDDQLKLAAELERKEQ